MRGRWRAAFVLGASTVVASTYACFGDDPVTASRPGDGGVGSNTDSTPPDAVVGSEPLVCDAPSIACGETCAVLATSQDHCGRCGHSCGGGGCMQGTCAKVDVVTNVEEFAGYGVSEGYVYLASNNQAQSTTTLFRCPVTGCAPKEPVFFSQILGAQIENVAASQGLVAFTYTDTQSSPSIVRVCPGTGCSDGGTALSGSYSDLFAASGKAFYVAGGFSKSFVSRRDCTAGIPCVSTSFGLGDQRSGAGDDAYVVFARDVDSGTGTQLLACDVPTVCDAGATVVATELPDFGTIHAGVYYSLKVGADFQPQGMIRKCTLPCSGGLVDWIGLLNYPTEFVVDASGVYWLAPNLDQIMTCPLDGCPGTGPLVLVEGLGSRPRALRRDDGFIYWVSDASEAGTDITVTRIAKR